MKFLLPFLTICSLSPAATLVGLWEFENSGNLAEATVGSDLTLNGSITSTTGSGATGDSGAANVPVGAYLTVANPIGANGGGSETNEYTLVIDFKFPTLANWISFMDTESGGDGDYFYSNSRGLGVASEGYVDDDDPPSSVLADTWHRLVLTVDLTGTTSTYVDGVFQGNHSGADSIDDRWGLGSGFELFDDNGGGEEAVTHVSNVALFDGAMNATEVGQLGATAGGAIPEPSSLLLGLAGLLLGLNRRR